MDIALQRGVPLDPHAVIATILAGTRQAVAADRVTLARILGDEVEVVAGEDASGHFPPWIGRRFPLPAFVRQPTIAEAVQTRRPVIGGALEVGSAVPEVRSDLAAVRHTLVVPLLLAEGVQALLVATRHRDEPFREADAERLQQLGGIAALALRNAELSAEAELARESASRAFGQLALAVDAAEDIGRETELPALLSRLLERAVAISEADRGSVLRLEGDVLVLEQSYDPPPRRARGGPLHTLGEPAGGAVDLRAAAQALDRRQSSPATAGGRLRAERHQARDPTTPS